MKASLFSAARYHGPCEEVGWPVAGTVYSWEAAQRSLQTSLDQFGMADELGFDWVSVAEHHLQPGDTTWIATGVPHRFCNLSATEPMKIFWTYASVDATRTLVATGETRRVDAEHGVR